MEIKEEINRDHSPLPEVALVAQLEEMVNHPPFSAVTLVSRPNNLVSITSSPNVAPLRMLELLWEKTEDQKVLPILSSRPHKLPRVPLN